jgi:hypothetical protein
MRPETEPTDSSDSRKSSDPAAAADRNAARDRLRLIKSRWAELQSIR